MTVDSLLVDGTRMLCTSAYNGPGTTGLRVKAPTAPRAGYVHSFTIVIPVKPDQDVTFGDGLNSLVTLNYHNLYNTTLVAFETHKEPWIADHPTNTDLRYESFLTLDLLPWLAANVAGGGVINLVSFSKGGWSAISLITRNPTKFNNIATFDVVYTKANVLASQDIASDWTSGAIGTEANYDANYNFSTLLAARKAPFVASRRIWNASAVTFGADQALLYALYDAEGFLYKAATAGNAHTWGGDWLDRALEGPQAFSYPHSSGTKILIHSDGVDATTTHLDSSPTLRSIGLRGNVQVDTAQSKFGGGSSLFDGTGDGLYVLQDAALNFGTADFGFEGWVRLSGAPGTWVLFDFEPGHGVGGGPLVFTTATDLVFHANNASRIVRGSALSATTWYHIAVYRQSAVTRLFVDGVKVGSDYADTNSYAVGVNSPSFGLHADGVQFPFAGHMEEILVTLDPVVIAARFGGFTPPTEAYTGVGGGIAWNGITGLSGLTGGGEMEGF